MRKMWAFLGIMLMLLIPLLAAADGAIIIPNGTLIIEEEAFEGDTAAQSLVIPNTVTAIGSRAFAYCTGLKEVAIAARDVDIAPDAFEGCGDINFSAHTGSKSELYLLSHGFNCVSLDEGTNSYDQFSALLGKYGIPSSMLQSDEFASKRLVTKMAGQSHLPDISAYNPTEIIRDGSSTFILQFGSEIDTENCYTLLANSSAVAYVEADDPVEVSSVDGAGITDTAVWPTSDPMGFDVYSDFVARHGDGKVTVAVVDGGVSDAIGSMLRKDSFSIVNDGQSAFYRFRHGTVIASIIKDCVGSASSKVQIMSARVVNTDGNTTPVTLGLGIARAADLGAGIINISIGDNALNASFLTEKIRYAIGKGCTVVVSAGNGNGSLLYPATVSGVIAVSGLNYRDGHYEVDSRTGSNVAYCAPGAMLKTSYSSTGSSCSTSYAAPQIAAAFALIKLDPYHSGTDMIASCLDLGTEGKDSAYGYGMPQLDQLASIHVSGLKASAESPMLLGDTQELSYELIPASATNQVVLCESSREDVVQVLRTDSGITLKAVGTGDAVITVTSDENRDISAKVEIHVLSAVKSIVITDEKMQPVSETNGNNKLYMVRKMQLKARINPENASDTSVEWTSLNPDVVRIDENGLVSPVSVGTVTIRAEAKDGYGAVAVCTIVVESQPAPEQIIVGEHSEILSIGETMKLSASIEPEDAPQDVRWSVFEVAGNVGSAVIDENGNLTGVSAGSILIKAESAIDPSVFQYIMMTVVELPQNIVISGESSVFEDDTIQLMATVTPEEAMDKSVKWESSNPEIAEVDESGLVTGIAPGEAIIFATSNANPEVNAAKQITVERKNFTITFDANGGNCGTDRITCRVREKIGTLPVATRDYYDFDGWYTAKVDGTKIDSEYSASGNADMTVYAHWIAHSYTITFNSNGGTKLDSITAYVDQAPIELPVPSQNHYTFTGWYKDDTAVGSTYSQSTDSNVTLNAKWTPMEYTMTFNANKGSCSTTSKKVTYNAAVGTLPTPTRTGCTFLGWFTSQTGGSKYLESTVYFGNGDITLYAHWRVNTVNLALGSNTVYVPAGESVPCNITIASNGYYVFYSTGSKDTVGVLGYTDGSQLTTDDNGGDGNNFFIFYNLSSGNNITLQVKYKDTTLSGNVSVYVKKLNNYLTSTGTYTGTANGMNTTFKLEKMTSSSFTFSCRISAPNNYYGQYSEFGIKIVDVTTNTVEFNRSWDSSDYSNLSNSKANYYSIDSYAPLSSLSSGHIYSIEIYFIFDGTRRNVPVYSFKLP